VFIPFGISGILAVFYKIERAGILVVFEFCATIINQTKGF